MYELEVLGDTRNLEKAWILIDKVRKEYNQGHYVSPLARNDERLEMQFEDFRLIPKLRESCTGLEVQVRIYNGMNFLVPG